MTAEQLEASRAERMRQNGHGAITIEDVRTWIEETGLCIFLPRSAQAGFTAPTFVEAIAGQRTTEPTLELISTAESLLVRLEAEGVAVRLNLAGQPGDQPDYVVAGWVLPYIYALRGDRDWRRSPQLTGSRQVSPLAVQTAKQIDTGNQTAAQIRDALGREVTETAVFRALHELWKQLRIIPVVPEVGQPALWQPLRQRFQKAIAEGASTSQVTAISVLASIYLQAVVAASMEDVEMFLSPLTSRSKIREVVRGLAATRQVHTTNLGSSPMFYVAGTLPEFPAAPSFQISTSFPPYRGSSYLGLDRDLHGDDDGAEVNFPSRVVDVPARPSTHAMRQLEAKQAEVVEDTHKFSDDDFPDIDLARIESLAASEPKEVEAPAELTTRQKPLVDRAHRKRPVVATAPVVSTSPSKPTTAPRPRAPRSVGTGRATTPAPRDRSRNAGSSGDSRDSRGAAGSDRRRAPSPRGTASAGSGSRPTANSRPASGSRPTTGSAPASRGNGGSFSKSNGSGYSKANSSSTGSRTNGNGIGHAKTDSRSGVQKRPSFPARPNGGGQNGNGHTANGSQTKKTGSNRPDARSDNRNGGISRSASGSKSASGARPANRNGAANGNGSKPRPSSRSTASRTDEREPAKASAAKRYSFSGQSPKSIAKRPGAQAFKPAGKSKAPAGAASAAKRTSTARSAESKRRG